jgi:hypothetical protein
LSDAKFFSIARAARVESEISRPSFSPKRRGVEVEHERIGISPEFGDGEQHTLRH